MNDWNAACDRLERATTAGFEAAVGAPRRVRVVVAMPPPPVVVPVAARRGGRAASLLGSAACVAGLALVAAGAVAVRQPLRVVGAAVPLVEVAAPEHAAPEPAGRAAPRVRAPLTTTAAPVASAVPARVAPFVPDRLVVPAAGVDSGLERLHLDASGELGVPRRYSRAGWWAEGPRPGENGAAVFVGHVDSTSGPAVFHGLPRLRAGDEVVVRDAAGNAVRFTVYRVERYAKERFPTGRVYGPAARPEIRLITCGGAFDEATRHYRDNIVVYAAA